MIDIGEHFSKQFLEYKNSVLGANREMYANIAEAINPILQGDVLDVGNGGIFSYDVTKVRKVVAVDVAFKDTSKFKAPKNVLFKYDDARDLSSIPDTSFDVVIYQLMLHHVTGKSSRETVENIKKVLKTAIRVLKPGGTIIIIENIVLPFVEILGMVVYQLWAIILSWFKKPMVFFLSCNTLSRLINKSGFINIHSKKLSCGKKVDLLSGTFPGLLIIPAWASPNRCYFFEAKKSTSF